MKSTLKKAFQTGAAFLLAAGLVSPVQAAWTDRTTHDAGDEQVYKHKQNSFTGPFDYAPQSVMEPHEPAPAPEAPAPQAPKGRCNTFTFDATRSFDPDRQKLTYLWNFGDGTTSDKPTVTHSYEKAGDYDVTLTVRDDSGMVCDNGLASTKVSANFPPTVAVGEAKAACLGESVTFDASASTSSSPLAYKWDFGDGTTGEGDTVSHLYERPGHYRVRVVGDDGKNTTCSVASASTSVSIADRASVSVEGPSAICVGRSANFRAKGSGGVSRYTWDFGDGTTVEGGSSVSHNYEKGGMYTVRVTADNGRGETCSLATDSVSITVNGTPVADAGENTACCVGKETVFDGSKSLSPDGKPLKYAWDFGDGGKGEGAQVTHAYEKSGTYRVVLNVTDESGSECSASSDSFTAVVNTSPEAVISVR